MRNEPRSTGNLGRRVSPGAFEHLATQAMEEGGGLDKLMETMVVMGEEERGKVMKFCEAGMPDELVKMGIEVGKAGVERMVQERVQKTEKRRKEELIKGGTRKKHLPAESGPGDVLNFGTHAG